MSVIQDIREKYAKLTVVLIALALVGFILTDYFSGQSRGMSSLPNKIGSVNGASILFDEFNNKVLQEEENLKSQGYPQTAAPSQQALDRAWNQEISRIILEQAFDELGITVGKKELSDLLYGPNPSNTARQYLSNPQQPYNPAEVKKLINRINKSGTAAEKAQLNQLLENIVLERQYEKFISLFSNSINVPRWLVEKQNTESSRMAKISFVRESYTSIADSTIKITDAEISKYINKYPKQYKQQESRSIVYVSFSAAPSAKDSAAALAEIEQLKDGLAKADSVPMFLASAGASFFDGYINGNTVQIPVKDSIFRLPVGGVFGPYLDGGSYVLARMMGSKILPDSVVCRHVLISNDIANGGFVDSVASSKIDSVKKAIEGGANWGEMVNKYNPVSDGSRQKAGEMTFSSTQIQDEGFAPEFAKFILFDGRPGERKVVKTSFGYHYIEIMSFIKPTTHYKVAYLPKEIVASEETENTAFAQATEFASESPDHKAFENNYEQRWKAKGVVRNQAANIVPWASEITGVGISRSLVRAVYDADLGEVLKPERVDNNYVVAAVTEVLKEGTMSVEKARAGVEPILRKKKKARLIKEKIGAVNTLEEAAAKLGGKAIEEADSLRISAPSSTLGFEPRILGAAFNPANLGKVVKTALAGMSGVFVVRVDQQSTTPVTAGSVQDQRKALTEQAKSQYNPNNPISTLRDAAEIKDNRSRRY
ncbi:MAG: peptidylprolyl isomerase [Bacteroidetes bacterium]|nr:peptidylprolyl isomerase [Bacteroidota bacterium]